jgi:hypothetical protein
VVYAAALGHLWGANPERGVYKTSDGGKTWNQVLKISNDAGVSDIAMDPESPDTLYAAAYTRRRTPLALTAAARRVQFTRPPMAERTEKTRQRFAYENGAKRDALDSMSIAKIPTSCTHWCSMRKAAFTAAKTKAKRGRR